MAVAHIDLPEVVEGDDVPYPFTFTDKSTGNPIDITGYTISMTVKENQSDTESNALISVDVASHTDPVNGQTEIVLPHTETGGVVGQMWYDVQLTRPDGTIDTIMIGRIPFIQGITDRVIQ